LQRASYNQRHLALLTLVTGFFIITLACSVSRYFEFARNDFFAYYKAAQRFLDGVSPYQDEVDLPFKYAPITVLYFVPFAFFSHSVARWIFLFVHFIGIVLLPIITVRVVQQDPTSKLTGLNDNRVLIGTLLAFAASLRFMEIEFRAGQVGILMCLAIFLGSLFLCHQRLGLLTRIVLGLGLLTLGAITKIHGLLVLGLFFRTQLQKSVVTSLLVVGAILILPKPQMWLDWLNQVKATTPYCPFEGGQYVAQGIFGFTSAFLGIDNASRAPMLLIIPYLLLFFFVCPRFRFEELPNNAMAFLLAVCAMQLLGVIASPLPWTHSYSVLFGIVLASWLCANFRESLILMVMVLFFALTPSGFMGEFARTLERGQSIFFTASLLFVLLMFQARRLSQGRFHTEGCGKKSKMSQGVGSDLETITNAQGRNRTAHTCPFISI